MAEPNILVLNSGSSSLKFGLFEAPLGDPYPLCFGEVEEIGSDDAHFWIRGATGDMLSQQDPKVSDQQAALDIAAGALARLPLQAPQAVGHRVVHGGLKVVEHQEITPEVLKELEDAAIFAPLHVPAAVKIIRQAQRLFPHARQFACLDTAFHRTLPEAASRFALPEMFWEAGVRRYGFHGLSCESVLHALDADVPRRMIVAHLGSGASITAIANGSSVDTTMGLTPAGGIVMSTRTGDLDPGVVLHLLRTLEGDAAQLEVLLEKKSGLLGISGLSIDMRQLHQAPDNPRAQMAIEIFCRSATKAVGSFVPILGGLDLLVFTGGIGENDAKVRDRICAGLEPLGVTLDRRANQANVRCISGMNSHVRVFVVRSDEDAQIARHVYRLLLRREGG